MDTHPFEAKIKKSFFVIAILMFGAFFAYNSYVSNKVHKKFIKSNYHGVITEFKRKELSHDTPDIKINNEWMSLGYLENKGNNYIKVGDSISKETNSEVVKIYRKDKNGNLFSTAF